MQRGIFHLYQLCGVAGLQFGLRDHEGDAIADQPGTTVDQRRPGRMIHGRSVRPLLGRILAGQPAVVFGRPVRARQDTQNAGRFFRLFDIDRFYVGHRMGRPQDMTPRLAAQVHIVQKLSGACQKPRVLFPRHRLPYCELTHSLTLSRLKLGRP